MISFEEAFNTVLANIGDFGTEWVSIDQSLGRILREEIIADRDFPPFDRVMMDGIAIESEQIKKGRRNFEVKGIAAAGMPQITLPDPSACLEVMTGAVLPNGTNTVIPYEQIEIDQGIAEVDLPEWQEAKNIHRKGTDRKAGETLISATRSISTADIGTLATVGKSQVLVSRLPKTVIVSSGDELVDIAETPLPHQIRKSNIHQLRAMLSEFQVDADLVHINDNLKEVTETLRSLLEDYDLMILSGGVSKGKFDYIPEALERLKVEKLFHRVAQRPGKPFWFGKLAEKTTVFAFPGNPVSSFMCAQVYLIPWLVQSVGLSSEKQFAVLSDDVFFNPDLTYFLQVSLHHTESGLLNATPVIGNGSGDLANLSEASAFMQLPRGKENFVKGESYQIHRFRKTIF